MNSFFSHKHDSHFQTKYGFLVLLKVILRKQFYILLNISNGYFVITTLYHRNKSYT